LVLEKGEAVKGREHSADNLQRHCFIIQVLHERFNFRKALIPNLDDELGWVARNESKAPSKNDES
jgi:hypothetical protein